MAPRSAAADSPWRLAGGPAWPFRKWARPISTPGEPGVYTDGGRFLDRHSPPEPLHETPPAPGRLHADRTPRGHHHHRHAPVAADAGAGQGDLRGGDGGMRRAAR